MKENSDHKLFDPGTRKSTKLDFTSNPSNDLLDPSYRIGQSLEENTVGLGDVDKINAAELMSSVNTLTNPYNKKTKLDL